MTAHDFLEGASAVLIIGLALFIVIGIHKNTSPAPDREEERRTMRDERRRQGRKQ